MLRLKRISQGHEMYRYDGNLFTLAENVDGILGQSYPKELVAVNDQLFFLSEATKNIGYRLFEMKVTGASTVQRYDTTINNQYASREESVMSDMARSSQVARLPGRLSGIFRDDPRIILRSSKPWGVALVQTFLQQYRPHVLSLRGHDTLIQCWIGVVDGLDLRT